MRIQKVVTGSYLQALLYPLAGLLLCCGYEPFNPGRTQAEPDLGSAGSTCNPSNCSGCCFNNTCQSGNSITGCGKSGEMCRVCVEAYYEICLPEQRCDLDPGGSWQFMVLSASIKPTNKNNTKWDGDNTGPDAFVIINGSSKPVIMNDYAPQWPNMSTILSAAVLTSDGVSVEIRDSDLVGSDDIIAAPRKFKFQSSDLANGAVTVTGWDQTYSALFGFSKKP